MAAEQLIEAAKELGRLRDQKEELEAELKVINKAKTELETQRLPQMMEDAEVEKMTIEGVGTLYTQAGVYASILASDRDKAYDWLREHGHGDIVKETVHHQSLTAWVKEMLGDGNQLPEFFNAKPTTTARLRRK